MMTKTTALEILRNKDFSDRGAIKIALLNYAVDNDALGKLGRWIVGYLAGIHDGLCDDSRNVIEALGKFDRGDIGANELGELSERITEAYKYACRHGIYTVNTDEATAAVYALRCVVWSVTQPNEADNSEERTCAFDALDFTQWVIDWTSDTNREGYLARAAFWSDARNKLIELIEGGE